jgi:thiamine-monophosphate kinase
MPQIKDIGEIGLIKRITRPPKDKAILVGIGDDAAVVQTKEGFQVLTTDCLVEGDHFRNDWFTPEQIGMKAIEINVSDVAAMGGRPTYALVSLVLPNNLQIDFFDRIYDGMWKACERNSLEIIGGNMAHGNLLVISITLIGEIEGNNYTLRKGAQPGDSLFVSGSLGNGRAGLRAYQHNLQGFDKTKKNYVEPKARLAYALNIAPYAHAMIDISDGLASEIRHICSPSHLGAHLFLDKIPINDEVREIARILGENEYDYVLYGGEDFEVLYAVPEENVQHAKGIFIGKLISNPEIKLIHDDKEEEIKRSGYDHFSNDF